MSYTISQIEDYQNRLSEEDKVLVIKHCNKYNIAPVICAWYEDMNDFYSDWVDEVGYSKDAADLLLLDNPEEFLILPNKNIIRFVR